MSKLHNLTKPIQSERQYLTIFLIRPEISSLKALEIVNTLLNQFNAQIEQQEIYNYQLAYKIDRNDRAYYVVTTVKMAKQDVQMLRRRVSESEKFLRVLVTKNLTMDITDTSFKYFASQTTKRGRILFQKKIPRRKSSAVAKEIKTRRTIGLMRCCEYFFN